MVKYGRGIFPGPRLNATFRGKTLRLYGDFEYEFFIGSFFLWTINAESFEVEGKVFSRENKSDLLNDLGVEVTAKKSKQLYETRLGQTSLSGDSLRKLYIDLDGCFLLLSVRPIGGKGQVKTKTKIPKPSLEESEKKPSFCSAIIPVSDINDILRKLVNLAAPDFSNEAAIPFSSFDLKNYYEISEVVLPENRDQLSASEIRLKALRRGNLRRDLEIDGRVIEKEFSFTA
ncbi:MAG: hypothetical protein ACFE7I_04520 [Candidatus Hodarchaeota archaeon]